MSANSSVFVAYECTLERIVELLQPVIGQRLEQVNEAEGRLFKKSAMGIEISARDQHGLEDDVGIEFSRYPIQISFTRYAGTPEVDLLTELCRILALIAASNISRKCRCECLVVDNLQRVIECFSATL